MTSELVQPVALFKGSESYGGNEVGLDGWTGVGALQNGQRRAMKAKGGEASRETLPGSLSPSCSFLSRG